VLSARPAADNRTVVAGTAKRQMPSESSYWIVSVPVQEEKAPEQMLLDVSSQLLREKACAEDDVAALLLPPLKVRAGARRLTTDGHA